MSNVLWHITAELQYWDAREQPPRPGEPFGQFDGRVTNVEIQSGIAAQMAVPYSGPLPPIQSVPYTCLRIEWQRSSVQNSDDGYEYLAGIVEEVSSCTCEMYTLEITKETM